MDIREFYRIWQNIPTSIALSRIGAIFVKGIFWTGCAAVPCLLAAARNTFYSVMRGRRSKPGGSLSSNHLLALLGMCNVFHHQMV